MTRLLRSALALATIAVAALPAWSGQQALIVLPRVAGPDGAASYVLTAPAAGTWAFWAPTPRAPRPVQFWQVRDALAQELPYSWALDHGAPNIGTPQFPRLLGKTWPTWCRLLVADVAEGEHTLRLQAAAGMESELPDAVLATNTDYVPMAELALKPGDVWIEAEEAETNFVLDDASSPIVDLEPRFGRAGGRVLMLKTATPPPEGRYYAMLHVTTDQGRYSVWVHSYAPNGKSWWASPPHSPYRWALDGESPQDWGTHLPEGRPSVYTSQQGGWYLLGEAELSAGPHSLLLEVTEPAAGLGRYDQALDCLLLSHGGGPAPDVVPGDATASREFCLRIAGIDSTNLLETGSLGTLRVAVDRRPARSPTAETLSVAWSLEGEGGMRQSGRGLLGFAPGDCTASVELPRPERCGCYRITATLEQDGKGVGGMVTTIGVIPPLMYDGPLESGYFGVAQDSVRWDVLDRIGVKWARLTITWALVESEPGRHNWDDVDRQLAAMERHGVYPIAAILTPPMWASTAPDTVTGWERTEYPPQLGPWRAFVRAVAERYRGRIRHYELWNEPWVQGYCWKAGSDEYAELTLVTREVLRETDPAALLGAYEWPHDLYSRGIANAFDAIAIHPYADPPPEKGYLTWLEAWCPPAQAHGHEIWLTEHGWWAENQPDALDEQANAVARSLIMGLGHGVTHYMYFDLDGWALGEGWRLLDDDGSVRPGLIAYAACERMLERSVPVRRIGRGEDDFCWLFALPDGRGAVACAWSVSPNPPSIMVPRELEAFDRFGNELAPGDLRLSAAPVYVRGSDVGAVEAALRPTFEPDGR